MASPLPLNNALGSLQQDIKSILELVGDNEKLAQVSLKPFKKVIQNLKKQKEMQEEPESDCMIIEPPKKKPKCKEERKRNGEENIAVASALLVWIMPFIRTEDGEKKFVDSYLRNGVVGYNAFRNSIQKIARPTYSRFHSSIEEIEKTKARFESKNGWLDNFAVNMQSMLWETLENKMLANGWQEIMCGKGFEPYKKKLLQEWTHSLKMCKTT